MRLAEWLVIRPGSCGGSGIGGRRNRGINSRKDVRWHTLSLRLPFLKQQSAIWHPPISLSLYIYLSFPESAQQILKTNFSNLLPAMNKNDICPNIWNINWQTKAFYHVIRPVYWRAILSMQNALKDKAWRAYYSPFSASSAWVPFSFFTPRKCECRHICSCELRVHMCQVFSVMTGYRVQHSPLSCVCGCQSWELLSETKG